MLIKELCQRDIVAVGRDDTAFKAAELMRQNHVGDVLVVEKKNGITTPSGIVTDRDIVIEIVATDLDPHVITVGDIMLPHLCTIGENAEIFAAIRLMTGKGIRRLPVTGKHGSLVGILTLDDLLQTMSQESFGIDMLLSNAHKNEIRERR